MKRNMKRKTVKPAALFAAALALLLLFAACGEKTAPADLWKEAQYSEDTTLGEGANTVKVTVQAGEKSVTFTVHTNKTNLGEALLDLSLIEGDAGQYGLYVKKVNGILADYDVDQSYWAFRSNGEMMPTGIDQTELTDGGQYELVYTR